MFETISDAFAEGGWGMYPIAMVAVFVIAVSAERVSYLFFKARVNKDDLLNTIHKYLYQGNLQRAITYCSSSRAPLANIAKAGLLRIDGNKEEIESAMEEISLEETPRIEKRTGYLAMLSNVAVLAGLLGTITGLIRAFAGAGMGDPTEKAALLARGISEAMNCTAFGLGTAIPALLAFSVLSGTSQRMIDDINETMAKLTTLILANRQKFDPGA